MPLRSKIKLENADVMEVTMTLTMPLKDWIELDKTMPDRWPAYDFKRQIQSLVTRLNKHLSEAEAAQ